MRESDALILILIPKYRHFKRWNAIIKNMAQGMSNTYTVTHYVKTTILITVFSGIIPRAIIKISMSEGGLNSSMGSNSIWALIPKSLF